MDSEGITDTSSKSNSIHSEDTILNFVDSNSSFHHPINSQASTTGNTFGSVNSLSSQFVTSPPSLKLNDISIIRSNPSFHSDTMSTNDNPSTSHQSNNWSNIPKLTASSFFDWKRRLETTLGARRLSSHILDDTPIPSEPNARSDFIVDDLRALEAIQFSCDTENFNFISDCTTARSAYLALCKYHNDSGGVTTANLFSELACSRLSSATDLKDHLLKFRNTHTELKGNLRSTPELKISDPFIAILLLKSLPPDFNSLVQTSLANFETLNLDRIYTLLNIEAKRLSGQSTDADSALVTINKSAPPKNKKQEQIKCSLGHLGHTDEKCRIRIQTELDACKKLLEQHQRSSDTAKTATSTSSADIHPSYYDQAFMARLTSHDADTYDTGATSHMSPHLSQFEDIKTIAP